MDFKLTYEYIYWRKYILIIGESSSERGLKVHTQQLAWAESIKNKFPAHFKNKRVLEIGAANINGSVREFFQDCEYIGIDVAPYSGVDIVSVAHEYSEPDGSFQVVCSTSELEHDMYWLKTLKKMVDLTCSGGLIFFSCASLWKEHGTEKSTPNDSLTVGISKEWAHYYKNITPQDITKVLNLNKIFMEWQLGLDSGLDLTFWGIKR